MTFLQNVVLKKSPRARRYSLKLNHKDRVVELIMPKRASEKKAYLFAAQHQDWIANKLSALPAPIPFAHGQIIPLFGVPHAIQIIHSPDYKSTHIDITSGQIRVRTNKNDPSSRITRRLKILAKQSLTKMVLEKASQCGMTVTKVTLRDTQTRWGSCSSEGHISFSWRLIFAPLAACDYVVAHEAAHLTYLDHSKAFWDLCENLSSDYKAGKKWMRDHGHTLMRYGNA